MTALKPPIAASVPTPDQIERFAKLTVEERFRWLVDTLALCHELATPETREQWRKHKAPSVTSEQMTTRAGRAAQRASWPVVRTSLAVSDDDDLSATTTTEQRLAMMWQVSVDAWASSGRPAPDYTRENAPGRVLRRGDSGGRD